MIGYLRGNIKYVDNSEVLIDVSGIGYQTMVPPSFASRLTLDTECEVWVYTVVKEDTLDLYAFSTREERRIFKIFLSVSGVGPKTALNIIDFGVQEVVLAVKQADVSFFSAVPRIGKKLAQKIIIELKNTLGAQQDLDLTADSQQLSDIREALTQLGYSTSDIQKVRSAIDLEHQSLEQAIKQAINYLNS